MARHRAVITPLRPAASRATTRAAICTVWAASLALALPQVSRQLILALTCTQAIFYSFRVTDTGVPFCSAEVGGCPGEPRARASTGTASH